MSNETDGNPRLNYKQLAPEGFERLSQLGHYLNTGTGLERSLQDLVRLLASLLNGCEYCIAIHTAELKKENETAGRIGNLATWPKSDVYTRRERAAFAWTEAVTNIQQGHAPDALYDEVRAHFTEVETVNLTMTIAAINAWNRLAISLGAQPHRG
jgi:AhpD family alkylhydroperoxidase